MDGEGEGDTNANVGDAVLGIPDGISEVELVFVKSEGAAVERGASSGSGGGEHGCKEEMGGGEDRHCHSGLQRLRCFVGS